MSIGSGTIGLEVWGPGSTPLPPGGGTPLPPLVEDRTVYVDAVSGDNDNDGLTPATAWRTLQYAWDDRQHYGQLRALYSCRLLGAGPYTMPIMGASDCDEVAGGFALEGDTPTVLATGTFTGDFAVNTIGTSAGLGVDTYKDAFVEVTSGPLAGAIFLIASNADASITVANKKARTTAATAITAGTTWNIWRPTTTIDAPAATAVAYAGMYNWSGGSPGFSSTIGLNSTRHRLYKLRFTGQTWGLFASSVMAIACRFEATMAIVGGSVLQSGVLSNGGWFGTGNANNDMLFGAGSTFAALALQRSYLQGVANFMGAVTTTGGPPSGINHAGGRIDPVSSTFTLAVGSTYFACSDTTNGWIHWAKTVHAQDGAILILQGGGLCAITSGSCLAISRGALVKAVVWTMTGGTTDAAGYGSDAFNGGRIYYSNQAPLLTGGTVGQDARVNTTAVANAFFSAAGIGIGELIFASCVARLSAVA